MLQSYRYINHAKEQKPSLLIFKNQNSNSKGANSNSVHWFTWHIRRCSMERFIFKIKFGKSFSKSFTWWILIALDRSLILIVTISSLVWQAFTRLLSFSFLLWYANKKFSLIKTGLLLGLNMYFFLGLGKFLFIIQNLLSMFPVYKTNNSFSDANSSILLTNPMTIFNIITCHINVR